MAAGEMDILIVSSRALCYYSAGFFCDRMEEALEARGARVTRVDIDDENPDFDALGDFEDGGYDGVIDINSKLPYLIDENGDFWLDKLRAPFFNYILDHPLYHHPGLSFGLSDYHAIGIDRFHCSYMEEYYPHLKSVDFLPVAGTKALSPVPFGSRRIGCLFSGTYIPEATLNREMNLLRDRFGCDYIKMIDDLLEIWDPYDHTLEECVQEYLKTNTPDIRGIDSGIPALMNALYPVDRIARNRIRENILREALEIMPVTLVGEGWEYSSLVGNPGLDHLPPRYYANSLEVIADSRLVLDITPAFRCGIHDRAGNAMANGSLLISNMSQGFDAGLKHGKNIYFFNNDNIGEILSEISNKTEEEKEYTALKGYDYYNKNLTWDIHAAKLMEIVENG